VPAVANGVASVAARGEVGEVVEPDGCAAEAPVGEEERGFACGSGIGGYRGEEFEGAGGSLDVCARDTAGKRGW